MAPFTRTTINAEVMEPVAGMDHRLRRQRMGSRPPVKRYSPAANEPIGTKQSFSGARADFF